MHPRRVSTYMNVHTPVTDTWGGTDPLPHVTGSKEPLTLDTRGYPSDLFSPGRQTCLRSDPPVSHSLVLPRIPEEVVHGRDGTRTLTLTDLRYLHLCPRGPVQQRPTPFWSEGRRTPDTGGLFHGGGPWFW